MAILPGAFLVGGQYNFEPEQPKPLERTRGVRPLAGACCEPGLTANAGAKEF